jgi:hypothetical protein
MCSHANLRVEIFFEFLFDKVFLMKKLIRKNLFIFLVSGAFLFISCDGILPRHYLTDNLSITLIQAENMGVNTISFLSCNLSLNSYYNSSLLGYDEIMTSGFWEIIAGQKININSNIIHSLDHSLYQKANIEMAFMGRSSSGRPVTNGNSIGQANRTLSLIQVLQNINENGYPGDTIEECYYLDIVCRNQYTNEQVGILRLKFKIEPIYYTIHTAFED